MFSFRYLTHHHPLVLRPCLRPAARRTFSSSVFRRAEVTHEDSEPTVELAEPESTTVDTKSESSADRPPVPTSFREFMASPEYGGQYEFAKHRNWLRPPPREGSNSEKPIENPFHMNPSFRPPLPMHDSVKNRIYEHFMRDPKRNNVRVLSQTYHISLKRVDAILRLKGLEKAWIKGKTLQTGFQVGMDTILLGENPKAWIQEPPRVDTNKADTLEEEEKRDALRQRYQRQYWESVPEDGREPVMPTILEHAIERAEQAARDHIKLKHNPRLVRNIRSLRLSARPQKKIQVLEKPGRPTIKFVDVGAKFLDVSERLKRVKATERNAVMKQKRLQKRDWR